MAGEEAPSAPETGENQEGSASDPEQCKNRPCGASGDVSAVTEEVDTETTECEEKAVETEVEEQW